MSNMEQFNFFSNRYQDAQARTQAQIQASQARIAAEQARVRANRERQNDEIQAALARSSRPNNYNANEIFTRFFGNTDTPQTYNSFFGNSSGDSGNNSGNAFDQLFSQIPPRQNSSSRNVISGDVNVLQGDFHVGDNNFLSFSQRPFSSSSTIHSEKKDISAIIRELIGKDEKTKFENEQCAVCLDNKRVVLFRPCKHCVCCISCTKTLSAPITCPTCRGAISDAETIFV